MLLISFLGISISFEDSKNEVVNVELLLLSSIIYYILNKSSVRLHLL